MQARIRKRQNDLKKTEDQIHLLETRDSEIGELLQREEIYTDVAKLMELNQEKQDIQDQLEALYERWEELAQAADISLLISFNNNYSTQTSHTAWYIDMGSLSYLK